MAKPKTTAKPAPVAGMTSKGQYQNGRTEKKIETRHGVLLIESIRQISTITGSRDWQSKGSTAFL